MSAETIRPDEIPPECAFHLSVIDDHDRTDHDLNMAAKHAFNCETCRPRVSDQLILRASQLYEQELGTN